jgi:tetratricopeptide (TPR) repeat protein
VRQYAASTGFDFQRLAVGELPTTSVTVPRALARAEALTLLAGMPASMRHLDFAQQHLDAAIAEEPGNGDAWALAGWIAETREDAVAAGAAYRRALGSTVKRAASWQLAGAEANAPSAMTEASVDHPKREVVAAEARQSAERALALAPEFGEAAALKGRAALVQKEYPAAIVALAEAQLRLPERSDIVFNRVVAHLGAGQLIQARALTEGRLRRIARPSLVAQARQMVAQRESAKLIEDAVAMANQAASSGDLDGAIAAFAQAEAKVETAEGKEYLRQQVTALEQSKREVSRIDAFNAAIAEINAGRVAQGKAALQALLVDCQETELCARAREILDQVEKSPKGRR